MERGENLMTLYLPGGTSYPAYPQATYPVYPQTTYPAYPQTYPIPYLEPSVYRVHYKIANLNGTQQQFNMDLQAYNENDAFQKALRYLPPFSQITKIRLQVTHPHL